jgi:hypothetical protein
MPTRENSGTCGFQSMSGAATGLHLGSHQYASESQLRVLYKQKAINRENLCTSLLWLHAIIACRCMMRWCDRLVVVPC